MRNTEAKLEALFDKIRILPVERQQIAIDALTEIADEPYKLSEVERAVLYPALDRMRRGEFVPEDVATELLDKPWR